MNQYGTESTSGTDSLGHRSDGRGRQIEEEQKRKEQEEDRRKKGIDDLLLIAACTVACM